MVKILTLWRQDPKATTTMENGNGIWTEMDDLSGKPKPALGIKMDSGFNIKEAVNNMFYPTSSGKPSAAINFVKEGSNASTPSLKTPSAPSASGNNQTTSLAAKAFDTSVNFNPLSAGIRALGDVGASTISGAFNLAATNNMIDWQKQQWQRDWDTARQMGLYSPAQIGAATTGTPSSSDVYKLNMRGLQRQPRTFQGSPFGV